jgi:hypothetical protein
LTERTAHPLRRLGRRPPKLAPALHFEAIWSRAAAPTHPIAADNFSNVREWELGANDQFGTCGPTSVANMRRQVAAYLAPHSPLPTLADVFDLYRRSGNPGFDPAGGGQDDGVVLQTMLEALREGGIGGIKPLAFAKVDVTQLDELRAAIAIFGGLLYGVDLQAAQQAQTDAGLWDYRRTSEWGGHAVLAGRYTSSSAGDDIAVVTWAHVVGTTDAFEAHQLEEAWLVIWPEHFGTAEFQAGIDQARLADAYRALTGRAFPVPPVPPPPASDPVHELAAILRRAWAEADAWLQRHGL